jgi:response regulator RpfG family c-di-GMP phosphodiesterase
LPAQATGFYKKEAAGMPGAAKNILAVDDEPKILEVVASLLESKGYKV